MNPLTLLLISNTNIQWVGWRQEAQLLWGAMPLGCAHRLQRHWGAVTLERAHLHISCINQRCVPTHTHTHGKRCYNCKLGSHKSKRE